MKLIAIAVLFYGILSSQWWLILVAVVIWEVASGFKISTLTWLDDINNKS